MTNHEQLDGSNPISREEVLRRVQLDILNYGDKPAMRIEETAAYLGVHQESVLRRIKEHTLISMEFEGEKLVPSWQFNGERPQVLPDVIYLTKINPDDPWGIAGILTHSQPSLDGAIPVEALKSDDLDVRMKTRRTMSALIKDLYGTE